MAPIKRRRRKAKRQIEDDRLGNIREYLFKIEIPKEWSTSTEKEGRTGANPEVGTRLRKRKEVEWLEETEQPKRSEKSLRLSVEDPEETGRTTNSRTEGPFHLGLGGPNSRTEKESTDGRKLGMDGNPQGFRQKTKGNK